ncbi:unnamed protein product, partial [Musa acuminata var. zebrina]
QITIAPLSSRRPRWCRRVPITTATWRASSHVRCRGGWCRHFRVRERERLSKSESMIIEEHFC